ncbi:hypothetical protein D3C72_1906570 [compost metagenome]
MLSAARVSSGAVMLSTGFDSRGIEPVVSSFFVVEQPPSAAVATSRQTLPKKPMR